jgi:hypothetical protein
LAIAEGIHLSRTHKDIALRMLARQLKEDGPRILEAQYKSFVIDAFPTKPYPDEVTVRFSPGAKDRNIAEFIGASFMKAIDQSGFIDRLSR